MRRWIRSYAQLVRRYTKPRALVLMYHRVAEPDTDIWDLAVSPAHFEQQLRVLKQLGTVISASELVERLRTRTLPRRSIAITFDDGYLDNYTTASPLLTHYQLPATFFIVSGNVGLAEEFWWDELAGILLLSERLPASLALALPGALPHLAADLQGEQLLTPALRRQHQLWRAGEVAPPTRRAALFYQLWQQLRPLPAPTQQLVLQQLRNWASLAASARPAYQSLAECQLRELNANPLFTLGAHTATHPALASHPAPVQAQELAAGRQALRAASSQPIELLAYPYGSYNEETAALAAQLGFRAAFTTEGRLVTTSAAPHKLGRFQVNDWDGPAFKRRLAAWFAA
ncbi:polysaccharide deacetylase family protein [Hymenobacter sp. RP-2-7]|uniref:Polysaccharide deacetylase family protein n=1 Tax=Hymenobacter polaris TaxID=2682546 RepID=A0A7Y0AH63_9BACT|nr:polysaccharide deacetylase family protein [Hymenobacter polaris]NML67127.1 polysaccharide deacetylase family protein [Hymenobacter polaris]